MRKLCHHKFKKLLTIIQLGRVEQGFDPNQTDFTSFQSGVSCCDINSLDFKSSKEQDVLVREMQSWHCR